MSTKYSVYFATCVAIVTFALALAAPAFVDIPILSYRPVEHAWSLDVHPAGGIAMDFFGRCLFATLVAGALAAVTYVIARRVVRREATASTVAVFALWTIGITFIAIAFFSWRLSHRMPAPPHEASSCAVTSQRR
jgi:hypothetical protein